MAWQTIKLVGKHTKTGSKIKKNMIHEENEIYKLKPEPLYSIVKLINLEVGLNQSENKLQHRILHVSVLASLKMIWVLAVLH